MTEDNEILKLSEIDSVTSVFQDEAYSDESVDKVSPNQTKLLRNFQIFREALYILAAIAGVVALFSWVSEADDRKEQRLLERIQLSNSGLAVFGRATKAETDKSVIAPSPVEMGLAILAVGQTLDSVELNYESVNIDCGNNDILNDIVVKSYSSTFKNCYFPDLGKLSFSYVDEKNSAPQFYANFENVRFGPREISFWGGNPKKIEFSQSSIILSRIELRNGQRADIIFNATRVENASIIYRKGNRGSNVRREFRLPLISATDKYTFSLEKHKCELIADNSHESGRVINEVYQCL